jgi:hypothetical protein
MDFFKKEKMPVTTDRTPSISEKLWFTDGGVISDFIIVM